MKILLKITAVFVVILNCAWSSRPETCNNCEKAGTLLSKIVETQKNFLEKEEDMKKNHVVFGPTEERKSFELAQGEAYRFVCDENKRSFNLSEKKALTEFVVELNRLQIESDAVFDLNGCFRSKVLQNRKEYLEAAQALQMKKEVAQILAESQPRHQDNP